MIIKDGAYSYPVSHCISFGIHSSLFFSSLKQIITKLEKAITENLSDEAIFTLDKMYFAYGGRILSIAMIGGIPCNVLSIDILTDNRSICAQ